MKRTLTHQNNINSTIDSLKKVIAYETRPLPFTSLGDREFEILVYQIIKEKINQGDFIDQFDNVDLMEGVGEKGRDSVLLLNQNNVGVIQCKNINANITKPAFAKEIIKFLIHFTIDESIIYNIDEFQYYFVASRGLAGSTKQLIREFNKLFFLETDLEVWIKSVIESNKAFNTLDFLETKNKLLLIFPKIKVQRILPEDLELWLQSMPEVLRLFFETKIVTDNNLIKDLEKKYLIPILNQLENESSEKIASFQLNFKEYLSRSYDYYSSTRTLVFGNQQKRLEDFYYPLDLMIHSTVYKTKKYPVELLNLFKKIIIVDSGGMGKSTIMKWMFTQAIKENIGIPVFVELRSLNKDNLLIDQIIKEISPLSDKINKKLLLDLIQTGNFIFFFDGYDEIKLNDRTIVTNDLNTFISKANKNHFIITSRPDNAETSFGDFQLCKIKTLTISEAFKLIEKIGDYSQRSQNLIYKLKENALNDVKEFLKNPLLISLLYKKFDYRASIPLRKQEFYYEVFEALFKEHDITKGTDYFERPKRCGLSFSEFGKVLRILGFRSVQENEMEYNKSILFKLLASIESELPNINFDPNFFIEDLITTVPLFQKIGLNYKWAHKSIQEYFAAEYICTDTKGEQEEVLLAIYRSERLQSLIHVMDLCYDIDQRTFRNSVLYDLCMEFIDFTNNTFQQQILDGIIPKSEIRDRQFRMFIDDNYLMKSDLFFKRSNDAKKHFISKVPKAIRMSNRISADNYYTGAVKKRENVRKLLALLRQKNDKLIKDIESKDLKYNEKDGKFRKSQILLFDNEINDEIIFIDDSPLSPVNNPKYFRKVSLFLRSSYFNYEQSINIINDVKKDRDSMHKKNLTTGF